MSPIIIISQAVASGGLSGARPVLTLFLLQLYAFFVSGTTMAEGMEWILNPYVIAVLGALSVVEHYLRTDADFEQLMETPGKVLNTAVAMVTAFLLVSMGYDAQALSVTPSETVAMGYEGLGWLHSAGVGGQNAVMATSVVSAALVSVAVTWLRARSIETLDTLAVPTNWWRWIEAGGVAGLLTVIVLLPVAALVVSLIMVLGTGAAGFFLVGAQRAADLRRRAACPECGHNMRVEASLCPSCGAEATPQMVGA